MDYGLDDYSSDSSPNYSDNDDDFPQFQLITKSTAPPVQLDHKPQSLLVQLDQSTTNPTLLQNQPKQTSHAGTVQKVCVELSSFRNALHTTQREAIEKLKQNDEIRKKIQNVFKLNENERLEAIANGFESDYSDDEKQSQINTKSTINNDTTKNQHAELLNYDPKNIQNKRRNINLDATSDDYTGSWGTYDGEIENKQRVLKLNLAKKQKRQNELIDEYGNEIEEQELKRNEQIKLKRQAKETSTWYGQCIPEFQITHSDSETYIDFDFNTTEYLNTIIPYQTKYINNQFRTKIDVEKEIEQLELEAQLKRKEYKKQCYDSYFDIQLASTFKTTRTITNQQEENKSKLYSIFDPPHGIKINKQPILYTDSEFKTIFTKPHSPPTIDLNPGSNGVCFTKFFPYTASHLLVGCLDGTVKLYPTTKSLITGPTQGMIRDYKGHNKGLRDMQWVDDGKRFITASLDGWIKLWDTETGKVLFRENTTAEQFKGNATPMTTIADHDNVMVGCGDGHIYQYDMRSGNIIMEYSQMQEAITTMIEVPGAAQRSILCSASDGNLYVYQLGIPSISQYVMHHGRQMTTRACVHPSEQFILANTHSNNIAIFKVEHGKVKLNRKKNFSGHLNSGYSLGITCSPDGRHVLSGDGTGKVMCWDFKTGKNIASHKVFSTTSSDVDWAWNHQSMYAVGSWDGTVKIYG